MGEKAPRREAAQAGPAPSRGRALSPSAIAARAHASWRAGRARAEAAWRRARGPAAAVGRLLVVAACVAGSIALARLVERYARTAPAFATRDIAVHGLVRLTREDVLSAAGLGLGRNVFEVGPEEAAERLERHPWVASAHVTRRLPGAFEIRVRERTAVALLALGGTYLVGDDGAVFKRAAAGDPVDLPVITGVDRARFTGDRGYRSSLLLEVVALLHDWRATGVERRAPIAEVNVESDGALTIWAGDAPTQVRLGRAPFREKLVRLRRVLERLAEARQEAAYVYLDNVRHPDRVTVRLLGEADDRVAGARPGAALAVAPASAASGAASRPRGGRR
jgi:cell division protein FtsQ